MVSEEFKKVVSEKNLLGIRIMIKDSLILDPTFEQMKRLYSYAKSYIPDLVVAYDGGYLEEDQSKWNVETMNEELVGLVNNFSDIRICHLKKLISVIYGEKDKKKSQNSLEDKNYKRFKAVKKMMKGIPEAYEIYNKFNKSKRISSSDIEKLERIASDILMATRDYKENR